MKEKILNAAMLHFQADLAKATANLDVYLSNSVGVAEHPHMVEEVIALTKQIAEATECVDILMAKQGYPARQK